MADVTALNINKEPDSSATTAKSSYSAWAKAGLVLGTTTGAFFLAKTTGALSWLGSMFSDTLSDTEKKDSSAAMATYTSSAAAVATTGNVGSNSHISKKVVGSISSGTADSSSYQSTVEFEELQLPASKKGSDTRLLSQTNPAIGEVFQVALGQLSTSVIGLTNGNFVIMYTSFTGTSGQYQYTMYGNLYNVDGSLNITSFVISPTTNTIQLFPSIASLQSGGFVCTWQTGVTYHGNFGSTYVVYTTYVEIFNQDATPYVATLPANITQQSTQGHTAKVLGLANGGFVISALCIPPAGSMYVCAQIYNATGNIYIPTFSVGYCSSGLIVNYITMASLTNGNSVIVWECSVPNPIPNQSPSGYVIYKGNIFNQNGITVSGVFGINTTTVNSAAMDVAVTSLTNGKFIVTFANGYCDNIGNRIYAQIYNSDGSTSGNAFIVSASSSIGNVNSWPVVAGLADGNFVVIWGNCNNTSPIASSMQIFTANGIAAQPMFQLNATSTSLEGYGAQAIARLMNGNFVVTLKTGGFSPTGKAVIYADKATLQTNVMNIVEGQTLTLTSANLNAIDYLGNSNQALVFNVTNVRHGHFALTTSPGGSVTSFTQQQISNGQVQFILDASNLAPSYMVSVSNGATSTPPVAANIEFHPAPKLVFNQITITAGQTILLTTSNLYAIDSAVSAADLTFIISDMQHCYFERVGATGIPILSFTMADIENMQIQFVQDGSTNSPNYMVSVSDGVLSTTATPATVVFSTAAPSPAPTPGVTTGEPTSRAPTPGVTTGEPTSGAPTPGVTTGAPTSGAPTPGVTTGEPTSGAPTPGVTTGAPTSDNAPPAAVAAGSATAPVEAIAGGAAGGVVVAGVAIVVAYRSCRNKTVTASASTSSTVQLHSVGVSVAEGAATSATDLGHQVVKLK